MGELRCKICCKSENDDCNFHKKYLLCNKHYLQFRRHGKFLDDLPSFAKENHNICCVCGDTKHNKYGFCNVKGEYYSKEMCGKHLNQMYNSHKITDPTQSNHKPKIGWTEEELQILIAEYELGNSLTNIADKLGRSKSAISAKAGEIGLPDIYVSKYSTKFNPLYKDYDWLKEQYIDNLMSPEDIAAKCNATPHVVSKWCEKFKLYQTEAKRNTLINSQQKELIMFSLLGDGHIDRREDRPLFIVSHAINQKDYLFWKYDILKSLCNKEPTYYSGRINVFGDKKYNVQPSYRLGTRVLNGLYSIRSMTKEDIISQLNEFGLAIHFLDDACRSKEGMWELCYAAFSDKERELYRAVLKERFGIEARIRKDTRYIGFGKDDSSIIDEIILRNIPNDLDVVKYKILDRRNVHE